MPQTYEIEFLFEHGYNWITIMAESAEEALKKAQAMTDDPEQEEKLADGCSDYDGVGDLQTINVSSKDGGMLNYEKPEFRLRSNASNLNTQLERFVGLYVARLRDDGCTEEHINSMPHIIEARAALAVGKP